MEEKPLISVIVPVYNAEKNISVCLQSLFSQTCPLIELLFINDCCTDDSFTIIENFVADNADSPITTKIIAHEKNSGVAAARNSGLKHATGTYIYYVDADDRIDADALTKMAETAINTQADIVGLEWFIAYHTNERRMKQPDITSPDDAFKKMTSGILRWNLWLFLVKRSLYEENNIRFMEGQNMGEDMMVMGKLFLCAKTVCMIHHPFYHYVQTNENSLTKEVSIKHLAQVTKNVEELERYALLKQGDTAINQIHFLKLNIKLPLLITDNDKLHKHWLQMFPESNSFVMKNKLLPLRTRLLQWAASKRYFFVIKLYYKFVFKFVYGTLYK